MALENGNWKPLYVREGVETFLIVIWFTERYAGEASGRERGPHPPAWKITKKAPNISQFVRSFYDANP